MSNQSKTCENSADQEFLNITPKNIGMMMPEKRNRRSMNDELFAKPSDLGKDKPASDQEKPKKDDKDELILMEPANFTPQAQSLFNALKMNSSRRLIWYEFVPSLMDSTTFEIEYYRQLKTPQLPRRPWQLLRRKLGKPRRFSPAFIEMERSKMERSRRSLQQAKEIRREVHSFLEQILKIVPLPLAPNARVGSSFHFIGLTIDKGNYSQKLLESIAQVKGLLAIKGKAMQEVAQWNDAKRRRSQSSFSASINMLKLLRVNADVSMKVLHEHLAQYHKEMEEQQAAGMRTALKCRHQAEVDLQVAEKKKNLKLRTTSIRDLETETGHQAEVEDPQVAEKKKNPKLRTSSTSDLDQSLQTLRYVAGQLTGRNSADMLVVLGNVNAHLVKTLPRGLSAHFKRMVDEVEPLRKRMLEQLKKDTQSKE